jgi:o-succinylbenzoate synthase
MTIDTVELHRVRVPLRTPYKLAFGPVTHFDTIVVELHDRDGGYGLGEATPLTGYTDETIESAWAFVTTIAAGVCGCETNAVERLLNQHIESNPFAVTALQSAAEMLAGSALLQISEATRVPLLGLLNAMDERLIPAEAEALLSAGYRTLKIKVGFDADMDARRVRLIQQVVGGRAALRLDANQGFDRDSACRFASGLSPEGIELFEQPCPAADWDAAVAVARVASVPMMLDESIYGLDDIERAADLGAARFIKLKLMKLGGLARLEKALHLIRDLGMEPVLGNGVACELGCWMEACVARSTIRNAGEMNGFLKPTKRLLSQPLAMEAGAMLLTPEFKPTLDRNALAEVRIDYRSHA